MFTAMDMKNKMIFQQNYGHKLFGKTQIQLLNIWLLLTLFLTLSACIVKSQEFRANKDFTRATQISENPDTAPYIKTFFESQTCYIHTSITDARECYIYCNSGLVSCVALAHIGHDCYMCDTQVEVSANPVPLNLRSPFLVWKSHLLTLDPCASAPCSHGNCTKEPGSFLCACTRGYGGRQCDSNMAACGNVCHNGFCLDTLDGYVCNCYPGYKGVNCEGDIDECLSSPCSNGHCTDRLNGYTCKCSNGFTGENCQVNIDECESTPCLNGQCIDGLNQYTCQCDVGYTSDNCDVVMECSHTSLLGGVPDSAFSASSELGSVYAASKSRLYDTGWQAGSINTGQWLQVDLLDTHIVYWIRTRGVAPAYVTQYAVSTSFDAIDWYYVEDDSGGVVIFDANTDSPDWVQNDMPYLLVTRFVRMTIVAYYDWPATTWGVRGCLAPEQD